MAYTLLINNVDKTALLDAQSLFANTNVDYKGSLSFSLTTTSDSVGTTNGMYAGQDVKFKDGSTTIFGGVVKNIRVKRLAPEIGSTTKIRLFISALDYNEIPVRRIATNVRNNQYAGDIVTSYVDDVLGYSSYDDNVGLGTIDDGAYMDSFYSTAESVKESLDKLATASGFKWYIDFDKDMYFIDEDTIIDADYDLAETTPTFTDFDIIDVEISLDNYRNKQWVIGQFDDTGEQVAVFAQNNTEISERATIEGTSGIYGDTIKDTESQSIADATIVAENALKRYGTLPYMLTFTTFTNEFVAGTRLKVNLPTVGINSDMYFLIENVTIEDLGGTLKSTIYCTRRSSTDFSTQRTEDYKDYFAKLINSTTVSTSSGSVYGAYGSYYDITTALSVSTATVNRELKLYLPYVSDIMTDLTISFTATATGTLTLTYKVDTVTKYTFTVDYAIGNNTRTFSMPESAHAIEIMTIDVDLVVDTGTLVINDYILTSRWEKTILIPAPILLSATASLI